MKRVNPGQLLNIFLLVLVAAAMVYPLWYVAMHALSNPFAVMTGEPLLVPRQFTLNNVIFVLQASELRWAYLTTVIVVGPGSLLSLAVTTLIAYPLSRKVPGWKVMSILLYITIVFYGGIIPTFAIVKATGLLNTRWALIIPRLLNPFYAFIMVKFFQQLSGEMVDSAKIDGASEIIILLRIILPISLALLATVFLFYAVFNWNAFFDALIYIRDSNKRPLQVLLRSLLIHDEQDPIGAGMSREAMGVTREAIRMSTVLLTVIPILFVYPWLQRYFVKGITIGAVKG